MSAHAVLAELAEANWLIPDPGNAGALPTSKSGMIALVTAASETRTLADPVKEGLILVLAFKTDGGDCAVTVASDVTQTSGENVVTFTDVGECIGLMSIPVGSGFKWREMFNHGAALT
jgi:hypothetical protein